MQSIPPLPFFSLFGRGSHLRQVQEKRTSVSLHSCPLQLLSGAEEVGGWVGVNKNNLSENVSLRASHSFSSIRLWKEHGPWNLIHLNPNSVPPGGSRS